MEKADAFEQTNNAQRIAKNAFISKSLQKEKHHTPPSRVNVN